MSHGTTLSRSHGTTLMSHGTTLSVLKVDQLIFRAMTHQLIVDESWHDSFDQHTGVGDVDKSCQDSDESWQDSHESRLDSESCQHHHQAAESCQNSLMSHCKTLSI